jgi:Ni,Fe-hydrogenase I small subunit
LKSTTPLADARDCTDGVVVAEVCDRAGYVLAMGGCAAFGGIPARRLSPTGGPGAGR